MTDATFAKSDDEVEKWRARADEFYAQTIEENNARLDTKWAAIADLDDLRQATLEEIKFIQSRLLSG